MIKFMFLMMLSVAVSAFEQLTWDEAELREDGSNIEAIEKYNIYHWYENILQPVIEVSGDSVTYSDTDRRVGVHVYEISTAEAGQEGKKSAPVAYYIKPDSAPIKILLTLEQID